MMLRMIAALVGVMRVAIARRIDNKLGARSFEMIQIIIFEQGPG